MTVPLAAARIAEEVLGFVFSSRCAGCDAPATLLCETCRTALAPRVRQHRLPSGLPVFTAVGFDGIPARVIRTLKEQGRTALARPLGRALRSALREAGVPPGAVVVPVPTSRAAFRRRGFRVPELLARHAGYRTRRLLLPARAAADQRALSIRARERNVRGTMRPSRRPCPLRTVVLLDDVMTTGATLAEAERTLRRAGFRVALAVAVAATPRRGGRGFALSEKERSEG